MAKQLRRDEATGPRSQWQDLPGELLQLIQARCRDSATSQALRLVCRSWRAVPLSHLHPHLVVPLRCSTRPHTPTPAATAPAAKRAPGKAAARGRKRGGGAVAATGAGAGAGPSHGTSPAAAQPALAAAAAPVLAHLDWLYRAFGRSLQTDGQLVLTLTDMWEGGDGGGGGREGGADRKGSSGKGRGAAVAAAAETSQKPLSQVLRRLAASGQQHLRIQHGASSPTAGIVSAPPPGPAASSDCCPSSIGGGACSDSLPTGCSGGGALRAAGYEPGQNAFPAFAAGAASNSFAAAASGAHAGCDQPSCSHCCCCAAAPAPSLRRLRCPGLGALSALRGLRSLELCGVAFGAPLLSRLSGLTQLTRLCSDCPLPVDQLTAAVTALTALAALHVAVTWPARQPPAQPQAQPQGVRWHELPAQVQQPPPPPSASTVARERRSRQQRRRPGGSQGTAAAGATPPGGGAGGAVGAAGGGAAGMAADADADCDDDVHSEDDDVDSEDDDDGLGVAPEDRDRHLELERWRGRRQPGAARSSGGGIGSSNSSSSGSSSGSESDGDVVSGLLRAAAMHRAWAPPAAGRSPSYALADEHMAVFMAALAALQRLEDLRLAVSCDGMGRTLLPPPGLLAAARRSCPRLRRFVMRVLSEWQAHGSHKTLYNWVAADTADHSLAAIRHDSAHNHQGVFIWQGLDWSSAAQQQPQQPQQPLEPLEQQQVQQPGTSAGLLGAVTSPTSPTSPGRSAARLGSTSAPPSASKRGTPAGGGGSGGGRAGASSAPRPFISQSDMGLAGAAAAALEPTPLVVAGPADVSVSLRTSGSSWLGACLAAPAALEAAVRSLPGSHVRGLALQDAAVRGQEPAVGAVGELPDVVLEAMAGLQRLAVRGVERRPLRRRRASRGRPELVAGAAVAGAAVAAEAGGSAASPAVAAAAAVPVGRAAGAALATATGRAAAAGTGPGCSSSGSGSSSSYSCDYLAQLLQLPSLTSLSLEASCPQWLDVILPLPLPLLQPPPAAAQAAGEDTQPQPPGQTQSQLQSQLQPQLQPQLQHLSLRLRGFHPYELYGQPVDSRSEEEGDEDAEDEGLEHMYCVGRNDKEEEADEEGAAGQQGRGGAAGGLALGGAGVWPRCAAAALPRLQLLSGLRTLQLDVPVLLELSWLPGSLEALQLALVTLQLPAAAAVAAGKTREPTEGEEPSQAGATGGQTLGRAQHQLQRPPLLPRLRRLTALSCHLPPLASLLPAAGCSCLQELALSHCSTLAPLGSAADAPAWRPPRYRGRAGALAPPTLQYRTEDNGPGRGTLGTAARGAASRRRTRRAPPPAAAAAPGSGPAGATRSRARNQGSASTAAAGAASAASVTPAAAAELLEADLAALADVAGSSLAVLCVSCPAAPHDVLSHAGGHDGAAAADVLVRGLRRLPRLQSFCWGVGVGAAGGGGGGGGAGRLRGEEEAQELLLLALAKEAAGDAASSSHSEAVQGQRQGQDPFPRLRMLVLHGGVTSAAGLEALVRLGAGCSTRSPATAPSHPGAVAGSSGGGIDAGSGGGSGGAAAGTTGGGGAAGGARVHLGGGGDVACMGDGAGMGGAGTDSGGGSGGGSGSGGVGGGGWVRRVVQVVGRGRALEEEEEEEAAACQLGAEAWMRRLQARLPLCLIKPVRGRDLE